MSQTSTQWPAHSGRFKFQDLLLSFVIRATCVITICSLRSTLSILRVFALILLPPAPNGELAGCAHPGRREGFPAAHRKMTRRGLHAHSRHRQLLSHVAGVYTCAPSPTNNQSPNTFRRKVIPGRGAPAYATAAASSYTPAAPTGGHK